VRLDIAGGWSDTPPFSLERVGRVLNLAVKLEGKAPVGAHVTAVSAAGTDMPLHLRRPYSAKQTSVNSPLLPRAHGRLLARDPRTPMPSF